VLCSKCGTNLPEGSQFCPECGPPATAAASTTLALAPLSVCRECGTSLPEGSQFCLKCGQPVRETIPNARSDALAPVKVAAPTARPGRVRARSGRRRRPLVSLFVLLLLGIGIAWVAISDNPFAHQLRDQITGARDQSIVETPFSITPQSFSYYEFSIPPGAVNVGVTGQFTTEGRPQKRNLTKNEKQKGKDKDNDKDRQNENDSDNSIETYVLTDAAFVVWRNGYSTGSHYESGRVAQGAINAKLPAGSGIYYLVFSNKFSPRTEKTVHATVLLHYQTWAPEWLLRMKQRLVNWLGFD
jgi:RNA polymerase subunit RPABC4/transcription elongation factor Spt4